VAGAPPEDNQVVVKVIPEVEHVLGRLLGACQGLYADRLVSLVVFGSVGRGTPRPDSDIDLLVVADPLPDGRIPRVREFDAVERSVAVGAPASAAHRLSPIFKTPAEVRRGSPLFLDMLEDGRLLYDRGGFFASELAALKGRLDKLGSKRIWKDDSWYWDLKPDFKPGDEIVLF
jgi:predicted nucleotidyltransferase